MAAATRCARQFPVGDRVETRPVRAEIRHCSRFIGVPLAWAILSRHAETATLPAEISSRFGRRGSTASRRDRHDRLVGPRAQTVLGEPEGSGRLAAGPLGSTCRAECRQACRRRSSAPSPQCRRSGADQLNTARPTDAPAGGGARRPRGGIASAGTGIGDSWPWCSYHGGAAVFMTI